MFTRSRTFFDLRKNAKKKAREFRTFREGLQSFHVSDNSSFNTARRQVVRTGFASHEEYREWACMQTKHGFFPRSSARNELHQRTTFCTFEDMAKHTDSKRAKKLCPLLGHEIRQRHEEKMRGVAMGVRRLNTGSHQSSMGSQTHSRPTTGPQRPFGTDTTLRSHPKPRDDYSAPYFPGPRSTQEETLRKIKISFDRSKPYLVD